MPEAFPRRALLLALLALAGVPPAEASDAKGELVKTIRVLVQNIYGRKENDCTERYKALAAHILAASPAYDVVALNEHWKRLSIDRWFACDDTVLTAALEKDPAFVKSQVVLHRPDAVESYETGGGNSVFSRHPIAATHEGKFTNGRTIPLSGYLMTRVTLAPGVEFDLWTVHLEASSDGCDDACRWKQATAFGVDVASGSGVPKEGGKGRPVLIVGDFNTGGPMSTSEKPPFAGNGGYANVMGALGDPRDLWLELNGGGADGFTYDCPNNSIPKCKYRERIDYVLLPEHKRILDPSSELYFVPLKIDVVKWKTAAGGNVSDHFGLDATLELRRRPAEVKGEREAISQARTHKPRRQPRIEAPKSWN